MPVHNAIGYGVQLTRAYYAALGLDEQAEGVVRASETLQPIHDLWGRPEWAWLRREHLWAMGLQSNAVALELAFVGFRNPSTTRQLLGIEGFLVSGATASRCELLVGEEVATDVDSTAVFRPRDGRHEGFPTSAGAGLILTGAGLASVGSVVLTWRQLANTTVTLPVPIVLSPGDECRIYETTVNQLITVSAWGWIRDALPSELD